jgi:formylglycine-generating enzyme required for sulfatase activity
VKNKLLNNIADYLDNQFVLIPSGREQIRRYRDNQKWISSDSKMSIPGSRNDMEEIQYDVEITSFYLAKFPVTQGIYDTIVKGVPSNNDLPAVNVSWLDAVKFCNLLSKANGFAECYSFDDENILCDFSKSGYRLPTDAEWQYACRAGSNKYQYGMIDDIAWYINNSAGMAHAVGKKQPNAHGLYDMLGNVWEWCWDLYDEDTYGSYRVFRGGSWAEEARGCGATCRRRSFPTFTIDDLGFRIARSTLKT